MDAVLRRYFPNMSIPNTQTTGLKPAQTNRGWGLPYNEFEEFFLELQELWKGVWTKDAATNTLFQMKAAVLWTINDFPARSSLSGWSGQGYYACPTCNEDTPSMAVKSKIVYVGHRRFLRTKHPLRSKFKEFYDIAKKNPKPNRKIELNWSKRSIFWDKAKAWKRQIQRHDKGKARLGNFESSKGVVKLKNYVRNKAKPKGSIAEGYVSEEALTFCSRYLKDDVETRFNRLGRNDDGLPEEEPDKFQQSLKIDTDILALPRKIRLITACTYPACIVNGVKFVVHERDILHTTQCSGVSTPGLDGEMYYGQLEEILELTYIGHRKLIRSLFDISPTPARVVDDIKAADAHFLSTCHECNKQLHGKDIYMYRGEKAFCSIECRSMEIALMEKEESMKKKMMNRNKHDCGSSTSYAPQQVPVSRSSGYGNGQRFRRRVEFDDDDIKRAVGGWGVAHGYIKAMSQLNKANAALEKATSTPNPTKSVVGSSRKTTGASRRKVVFDCSGSRKTMMRVLPCFSLCGGGFNPVD
ncbi:reverse transcriptase domain-containing protein [Tanacetum coccineum]|uniref:Reverse transcriptase domain-containing protein n=1 Tax=Tanacetum coccineum TaxID=301880 RepID=A0ABQ4YPH6_9ASTR